MIHNSFRAFLDLRRKAVLPVNSYLGLPPQTVNCIVLNNLSFIHWFKIPPSSGTKFVFVWDFFFYQISVAINPWSQILARSFLVICISSRLASTSLPLEITLELCYSLTPLHDLPTGP
jgi:energy-coupling factor transporter transmembrane protein EcfT